jgi:hypothetical protein
MKTSEFDRKIHNNNVEVKKDINFMDGSWGMDGDRMVEHGKLVHGVKT